MAEKNGSVPHNGPASQNDRPEDEPRVKYLPGIWNQYYAAFSVSVAAFGLGASSGWASPMILILESFESPVGQMTLLEISPLETLPAIAALFGTVIFAVVMTRFGRKICGYSAVSVSLLGWLFLLSATGKTQLYVGRFITGMSSIGLAMIGPIYLSEISYVEIRGSLMAYTQFASHCGTLVSFLVGAVCETEAHYRLFTAICMIGPILFPFFYFWIPESPQFLLLQSKHSEARQALSWYRGGDMKLVDEDIRNWSVEKQNLNWRTVLKDRANRKAIIIFVFLFCFTVLSGTAVLSGYASKIFQNLEASKPNFSAAVLACIKFISSLAAIQLIDRFGRRALVLFSYVSMSICLLVLTVYSYFQETDDNFDVTGWKLVPMLSLGTFVATSTVGVGTVSEVIASEMLTPEIKGVAIGFVGIIGTLVVLSTLQMYAVFVEFIGSYFNFLVEALFATSGIYIAWKIVPETRGKTMVEIRNMLIGNEPYVNKKDEVTKL